MDRRRRRYVPSSEGLEGRAMLSTTAPVLVAEIAPPEARSQVAPGDPPSPSTVTTQVEVSQVAVPTATDSMTPAERFEAARAEAQAKARAQAEEQARQKREAEEQAIQDVIETRLQRIDRLPIFLKLLDLGRTLPEEPVIEIQNSLRPLLGQLRPPVEAVAESFIDVLRNAIAERSVSRSSAVQLNNSFGAVLRSAGAPEATVARLQAAMNELVQAEVSTSNPVVLVTNDYAIVLQTALGVGRPIRASLAQPSGVSNQSLLQNQFGAGGTPGLGF